MTPQDQDIPPFLRLPPELRVKVFRYLLAGDDYIYLADDINSNSRVCRLRKGCFRFTIYPAVLCTNKIIHREASGVLYQDNTFSFADISRKWMIDMFDSHFSPFSPLSPSPSYFHYIRSVAVDTSELNSLYMLAQPRGLRKLTIFAREMPQYWESVGSNGKIVYVYSRKFIVLSYIRKLKSAGLRKVIFDETCWPLEHIKTDIKQIMAGDDSYFIGPIDTYA